MNRDDYDDDDSDDYEIINGKRVLKDGHSVRVPMRFMDAVQRSIALSRPGFRYADDDDAQDDVEDARDEYIQFLQDAHKTPVVADDGQSTGDKSPVAKRGDAAAAHAEYVEYLRTAHQNQTPSPPVGSAQYAEWLRANPQPNKGPFQ